MNKIKENARIIKQKANEIEEQADSEGEEPPKRANTYGDPLVEIY